MKLGTIQYKPSTNNAQLKAQEVGMAARTFQSEKQLFDQVGQITGQLADKFSKIEQQEAQLEYKQKLLETEQKLASKDTFSRDDLLSLGLSEMDTNIDWNKESFKDYEIQSAVMRQAMKVGVEEATGKVGIPSYAGDLKRRLEESNIGTMRALAQDTAARAEQHAAKTDVAMARQAATMSDLETTLSSSRYYQENPALADEQRRRVEGDQWRTVVADLDTPEDLMKVSEYLNSPESRENTLLSQQDRDVLVNKVDTKVAKIVREMTAGGVTDAKAVKQKWPIVDAEMTSMVKDLDANASRFLVADEAAYEKAAAALKGNLELLEKELSGDATYGTKVQQVRDNIDALVTAQHKSQLNLLPYSEAVAYVEGNFSGTDYDTLIDHVNARRAEATKTAPVMALEAGVLDSYEDLNDPAAVQRMRDHFGVYDVATVSPEVVEYFEAQLSDADNMSTNEYIDMVMAVTSIPGLVNQIAPTNAVNKTTIAVANVYDPSIPGTGAIAEQIIRGSRNDSFKADAHTAYSTDFQARYGNSFANAEEKNAAFDAAYNYMRGDLSGSTSFEEAMEAAAPPLATLGGNTLPISVGLSADGFNTYFTKVLSADDVKGVDNFTPFEAVKYIRRGHLVHVGDNQWEVGLPSDPSARMTVNGEPLRITYGAEENARASSYYMNNSRGIYGESTRRGNRSKYGARTPGDAAVPSRKPR